MYAGMYAIASRVTLLQRVIVNANYFDGYVSMMQINQFTFSVSVSVYSLSQSPLAAKVRGNLLP